MELDNSIADNSDSDSEVEVSLITNELVSSKRKRPQTISIEEPTRGPKMLRSEGDSTTTFPISETLLSEGQLECVDIEVDLAEADGPRTASSGCCAAGDDPLGQITLSTSTASSPAPTTSNVHVQLTPELHILDGRIKMDLLWQLNNITRVKFGGGIRNFVVEDFEQFSNGIETIKCYVKCPMCEGSITIMYKSDVGIKPFWNTNNVTEHLMTHFSGNRVCGLDAGLRDG